MRIIRLLAHRLRSLLRRSRVDADLRREVELHFEQLVRQAIESGKSEREARLSALREFGPLEKTKEDCRDERGVNLIDNLMRDIGYALRTLRINPGFAVPALLSLALGIGAVVAIFSVVDAVLLRPLPYREPEKLVGVFNSAQFQGLAIKDWPLTLGMYAAYRQYARSFEDFGVWISGTAAFTGSGEPEQVASVTTTHGVLRALGVKPSVGRWFSPADETPGAQKALILSHRYWRRKFGGDPSIVGRLAIIDFVPHRIIGVMPESFHFLDLAPDVFLSQTVSAGEPGSGDANYSGLGRLKPGMNIAQANEDIARVLGSWGRGNAEWRGALEELHVKPNIHELKQDVVGDVSTVLEILTGVLAIVFLLVCANVANLVLIRAQARRQEFATRAALGAGWKRIAAQVMIESLALAALGGAAGLGLAFLGLKILTTHASVALPRVAEISINAASVSFATACSLFAGTLFGSVAVLRLGRNRTPQNARGASRDREHSRAQNAFVVTQVAFALVLLIAAGLLVRSFLALGAVTPGFTDAARIQTVRLFIPEARIGESDRLAQAQADILHEIAATPGVTAAGFATALPLELDYHNGNPISVEDKTPIGQIPPNRTIKSISPGLFAALGTRLLAGRDFTWDELFNEHHVAIVSANMAREYWGQPREAIGKRLRINGSEQWSLIVGVAENVYEDGVDRPPPGLVYFPGVRRGVSFAVRSSRAGTDSLRKEITAKVHAVDSSLPLTEVRTMSDLYRLNMARRSFALALLALAASMSMMLSVIGVYGVLAYAVGQRRKEIGIRVAVGAEPRMIRSFFLRQGFRLVSIGVTIGFALAGLLSPSLASLLFGIKGTDWLTYGISGVTVLVAALAASYIPARRAGRVDPIESLRHD